MKFHLYEVNGYAAAIMSLRMSRGKLFTIEKAQEIQDLVYAVTDRKGFLVPDYDTYINNIRSMKLKYGHKKITGDYEKDIAEFKRLLNIVMDNAMGHHDHTTLMSYIDITFFTEGLHRGAQDDLDAHARGFNNRITRFSTRLATIDEVKVSEWYQDKVIPFHDAIELFHEELSKRWSDVPPIMPKEIEHNGNIFCYTPFGYVLKHYAEMNHEASIRKDVVRGLIPLGTPGPALWKASLHDLRYIYFRRGKLTKANPELKIGIEQLADQITEHVPVFGEHFRDVFTDSGQWENMHQTKTITLDEWKEYQNLKRGATIPPFAFKEESNDE